MTGLRSLEDLGLVARQLKAAREKAEALAAAQAEARKARERERNLFALSVGAITPLRQRNQGPFSYPTPSRARCSWSATSAWCWWRP